MAPYWIFKNSISLLSINIFFINIGYISVYWYFSSLLFSYSIRKKKLWLRRNLTKKIYFFLIFRFLHFWLTGHYSVNFWCIQFKFAIYTYFYMLNKVWSLGLFKMMIVWRLFMIYTFSWRPSWVFGGHSEICWAQISFWFSKVRTTSMPNVMLLSRNARFCHYPSQIKPISSFYIPNN